MLLSLRFLEVCHLLPGVFEELGKRNEKSAFKNKVLLFERCANQTGFPERKNIRGDDERIDTNDFFVKRLDQ